MSFAVQRIDHVEVMVSDPEAAARWYREVLGLEPAGLWDSEPKMIGAGGTLLALFKADPAAPRDSRESAHHWLRVAWRTDEAGFAAAQEHLTRLGISFRGPADYGIARSIYFADPDGNLLEITCYRGS